MDKSTSQEQNRMTLKHRFFGVVLTTFLGCSALVLSAQEEVVDTDGSTSTHQSTNETDTTGDLDVEPIQDQLTKTYLQALSKQDFKEFMLNMDQYSKNDQDALCLEYQRRCSDDSKDYSSDLCPDDIEPTFGTADEVEDDADAEESQDMPKLVEQTVQVGSTVRANSESEKVIERDPRLNNEKSEQKNGRSSWRNKPKKPKKPDFTTGLEN